MHIIIYIYGVYKYIIHYTVVVALLRVLCKHASPISCARHNKFTYNVTTTTVRVCICALEFIYYNNILGWIRRRAGRMLYNIIIIIIIRETGRIAAVDSVFFDQSSILFIDGGNSEKIKTTSAFLSTKYNIMFRIAFRRLLFTR